jgi:hypothetical protein
VEVLELKNRSVRILPLKAAAKIYIPRRKNEPQKPTEEKLQLMDGSAILEAKSLDDLATQLRERFPDEAYERRLRRERDREAEERRADAMNKLIDILVEAVVKEAAEVDDAGRTAKL